MQWGEAEHCFSVVEELLPGEDYKETAKCLKYCVKMGGASLDEGGSPAPCLGPRRSAARCRALRAGGAVGDTAAGL